MSSIQVSREQVLYFLAFLLAVGLRLYTLGRTSLSDFEANLALQALNLGHAASSVEVLEATATNTQPAYVSLTGALFLIYGSSNTLARFLPALIGSALVFLPYIFKGVLGKKAALVMAFGVALDPGLVVLSQLPGGAMLALGFGLFTLGFAYSRRYVIAGVLAGLALLSGAAALHGLIGITLAWGASKLLGIDQVLVFSDKENMGNTDDKPYQRPLVKLALSAIVTILIVGTFFLRHPQGLSDWAMILPVYLTGWVTTSGVPAFRLVIALVVYQLLILIFGLISIFRGWIKGNAPIQRLSLWLVFAFLLALLYPNRQVGDLAWTLIPLWALAAIELARYTSVGTSEQKWASVGLGVFIFLLMTLLWLNLAGMTQSVAGEAQTLRIGIILGVLAFIGLTTILVGFGWSWFVATRGLVWGTCAALCMYMFSSTWHISQFQPDGPNNLWKPSPVTDSVDLLTTTVGDISEWSTGRRDDIDIVVMVASPALQWVLRDYSNAQFVTQYSEHTQPSIVVTSASEGAPSLVASYRGQDFPWRVYPGWKGVVPPDIPTWIVLRQAPSQIEHVILWARSDLFPDGSMMSVDDTDLPDGNIQNYEYDQWQ